MVSLRDIAEENEHFLRRYRDFRRAADAVATAWSARSDVLKVVLIGSLARVPWKEVCRHNPYRRKGIELWHECKDVDLALWLTDLAGLDEIRRAKDRTLREFKGELGGGVANHQIDIFVLEPGSDRYLGRLCSFSTCPKQKLECLAPGCGAVRFLRQYDDFEWWPRTIASDPTLCLFDRATGARARAADLPLPTP
ncbi:MAG: hypothetical protein AB7O49_09620 [Sphingomonadales bacterium]